MVLSHEYIVYGKELLPINWIFHRAIEPVSAILPHWHESVEISYTRKGSINSFIINGNAYITQEQDILIMNPVEVHSIHSAYDPELYALTIQISLDFLKQLIPDLEFKRFVTFPTQTPQDLDAAQKLQACLERFYLTAEQAEDAYTSIEIMSITYEMIYLMAKDWLYDVEYSMLALIHDKKLGKIERMVRYIQDNYAEPISIDSLADRFHISPYYVSKLFKQKLNIGMLAYLQLVRIRHAEVLLISTNKPIHVISDLVGFPNEKSFRRVFQRVYDQTPKNYQLIHTKSKKNT